MRLNKYIAQAGLASRRKADQLIAAGKVKINGVVRAELGYDVKPEDRVEVEGRIIQPVTKLITVLLNKPKGYITSTSDEYQRPTVFELVEDIDQRLFPIGRLDYNTSGLLLMTNDGDLAYKITHPKHLIWKTYRARVVGVLSQDKVNKLRNGVDIGGFKTSKAQVQVLRQGERSTLVEIKIHEGKNRQIRKMFAAVGNKVVDLERIAIGDLLLGHLKEGHYRKLNPREIEYLKQIGEGEEK